MGQSRKAHHETTHSTRSCRSAQRSKRDLTLINLYQFNITQLNKSEEKLRLKKRIEKAQRKGKQYVETKIDDKLFTLGVETMQEGNDPSSSFKQGAHLTQLLTLLPQSHETNENEGNLKICGKSISAYVKVNALTINESSSKPQVRHIIKTLPRQDEVSTAEASPKNVSKKDKKAKKDDSSDLSSDSEADKKSKKKSTKKSK